MNFGVFIHRIDSVYDDSPAERYQFPKQYLTRVRACIGGWIVYYEPTKVLGTKGYFAVAQVERVIADPHLPDMYVALITPGTYLDFATPVPFDGPEGLIEHGLLNEAGKVSGRAQAAVRPLSPADFERIVAQGLAVEETFLPRETVLDDDRLELDEEQAPFHVEGERVRATFLASRIVRDRVFRRVVLRAYDQRCAISGLKLINGGGRAEVAAAHIRPVEQNGPDIVSNGLALSGTAHWMFDRGLIGLSDDLEILISRQVNDRDGVESLINKTGHLLRPARQGDRPNVHFVRWHRENCFKQ